MPLLDWPLARGEGCAYVPRLKSRGATPQLTPPTASLRPRSRGTLSQHAASSQGPAKQRTVQEWRPWLPLRATTIRPEDSSPAQRCWSNGWRRWDSNPRPPACKQWDGPSRSVQDRPDEGISTLVHAPILPRWLLRWLLPPDRWPHTGQGRRHGAAPLCAPPDFVCRCRDSVRCYGDRSGLSAVLEGAPPTPCRLR